ncbi:hypothetical protein LXL04_003814 [Taraxacum kok-saghyz]
MTRLTVFSKKNCWSLGFTKRNHSPNKTVAGASRGRASARVYLHIYPAVVPIDVEKSEKNPGFTFPVPIDVSPYHQRLARGKQRSSNRGRFVLTVKNVELSQQVQAGMENMLKMITEIDQSSSGIIEEIEKCKYSAFERKRSLEEDKDVDSALDSDDIEDEIDEEVDKVLTSLAGETAAQLPEAVRKENRNESSSFVEFGRRRGINVNPGNIWVCSGPNFLLVNPSKCAFMSNPGEPARLSHFGHVKGQISQNVKDNEDRSHDTLTSVNIRASNSKGSRRYESRKTAYEQRGYRHLRSRTETDVISKPELQTTNRWMFWNRHTWDYIYRL